MEIYEEFFDGKVLYSYIKIDELPKEERSPFKKWIKYNKIYQPIVFKKDGVLEDAAYAWDYETWWNIHFKGIIKNENIS